MLNYPFEYDSFTAEFSLCNDINGIIANNEVFEADERKFAVGSDGGELIFYIYLNGDNKVYIYDFERSHLHDSIESDSWDDYLKSLIRDEEEMKLDGQPILQKNKHKKWWEFWR
jgi:hypothetical protein